MVYSLTCRRTETAFVAQLHPGDDFIHAFGYGHISFCAVYFSCTPVGSCSLFCVVVWFAVLCVVHQSALGKKTNHDFSGRT